jgi:hypothetical protein
MAEAPSSVRRLLTVVRARVSSLLIAPRRARPVSTLAVSLRGPERPLGQAPASLAIGHGGSPRWTRGPATPALVHEPWTDAMAFPIRK